MPLIQLRAGPLDGRRLQVEEDLALVGVDAGGAQAVYARTETHTPDGLTVYVPEGEEPPRGTLGWEPPAGVSARSTWIEDAGEPFGRPNRLGRWYVEVAGNGHLITRDFTELEVAAGDHLHPLAWASQRLCFARYPRRRRNG